MPRALPDGAADKARNGLVGGNEGRELLAAKGHAAEHGGRVPHERNDKRHEDQNLSGLPQIPDTAVHDGEHYAREHAERDIRKRHRSFFAVRQNGDQAECRQEQKRRGRPDDLWQLDVHHAHERARDGKDIDDGARLLTSRVDELI